jgi:Uma2 family endonuclease
VSVRTKLWTREEYDRLVAAGAFAPEARVQLIAGEIVEMTPQGPGHATAIRRLQQALGRAFSHGHEVRAQMPLALAHDTMSEPEPDVAVVIGTIDDYRDHHPAMAILVAEVADTSVEFDRTRKAEMYARSHIPEYWILNLVDHRLEVLRQPRGNQYEVHLIFGADDSVSPLAAPEARLKVSSLFP